MKTVTPKQFKKFGPCWLETAEGRKRYARVAAMRDELVSISEITWE